MVLSPEKAAEYSDAPEPALDCMWKKEGMS
jgi:hypothetical protein